MVTGPTGAQYVAISGKRDLAEGWAPGPTGSTDQATGTGPTDKSLRALQCQGATDPKGTDECIVVLAPPNAQAALVTKTATDLSVGTVSLTNAENATPFLGGAISRNLMASNDVSSMWVSVVQGPLPQAVAKIPGVQAMKVRSGQGAIALTLGGRPAIFLQKGNHIVMAAALDTTTPPADVAAVASSVTGV